jgi:hypothetical protein
LPSDCWLWPLHEVHYPKKPSDMEFLSNLWFWIRRRKTGKRERRRGN